MKKAPIPKCESSRIEELKSYEILDTETEIDFDEITELASELCGVPIALVSLIDETRQWFKSHHGLDATETPRDVSFCGHAIHQEEIFEIKNALEDPRFSDNPLVVNDPRVIFYAGYPLQSKNGYNLGTLCVIDHEPKELSDSQKRGLEILGKQVIAQMDLRRNNMKLKSIAEDIRTQALELERQRAQSIENAKMASLGQMSGGVAHEINNPLAIISMSASQIRFMAGKGKNQPEDLKQPIDMIESTIERISKIIRGLRMISRDASADPMENIRFSDIAEYVLSVTREKFKINGVDISVEGNEDLFLNCRSGEISQVLLNLVSNSFDAVQNENVKWVKVKMSEQNGDFCFSVSDSGPGIEEQFAEKVMQPFFTTKPAGKGTGLGLSISKSIIEAHGGRLALTKDGEWTEMKVVLPQNYAELIKTA